MTVRPRLLDHPFYTAWTRGEIPLPTLGAYHQSYGEFIRTIPSFWEKVVNALHPSDPHGLSVIIDETDHIRLWQQWGTNLPRPTTVPTLSGLIADLQQMSPSQLLGALQAFELQQPEVARTKREGLLAHYGFAPAALRYFDEHEKEDDHIRYGRQLAESHANREEFRQGLEKGAELFYRALDVFVDQATLPTN